MRNLPCLLKGDFFYDYIISISKIEINYTICFNMIDNQIRRLLMKERKVIGSFVLTIIIGIAISGCENVECTHDLLPAIRPS